MLNPCRRYLCFSQSVRKNSYTQDLTIVFVKIAPCNDMQLAKSIKFKVKFFNFCCLLMYISYLTIFYELNKTFYLTYTMEK